MRILLYHQALDRIQPMQRMFTQAGIAVDTCQSQERLLYLSMTELYAAIIVWHRGELDQLLDAYNSWKKEGCRSLFIVVTSRQSAYERAQALQVGIDQYYMEPYSYRQLLSTIIVHEPTAHSSNSQLTTRHFNLDFLSRSVSCNQQLLELSKTEFSLLALLIRRQNTVLSRVQIWEEVWGYEEYPLHNTIDVHITRLRQKLPNGLGRLIKTVRGIGYRLQETV